MSDETKKPSAAIQAILYSDPQLRKELLKCWDVSDRDAAKKRLGLKYRMQFLGMEQSQIDEILSILPPLE